MIQIDVSGVAAFNAELTLALAELDREINAWYVGETRKLFKELLYGTPQFSGDLVRNWNYSVNAPDEGYYETPQKELLGKLGMEPLQRGDYNGINFAMARAVAERPPTWRDKVYFTNATPIADAIEHHTVYIRPVNLVNGSVAMIQHMADKYS